MHKFIETFKTKANNKSITAGDMIALCIFRAMKDRSSLTYEERLKYHLKRAFSAGKVAPHRQYPYQAIIDNLYQLNGVMPGRRWDGSKFVETKGTILNQSIDTIFDEEEIETFRSIFKMITRDFVRNL